jgi:hypothetical protein
LIYRQRRIPLKEESKNVVVGKGREEEEVIFKK